MMTPIAGDYYRHVKSGGNYTVICVALEEATEKPVVIYQSQQDHRIWSRPMEDFMDGRFKKFRISGSA
jgi:hypothetical protein